MEPRALDGRARSFLFLLCTSYVFYNLPVSGIVIINDTLARSLEPVVTECKEHTIHTQTQIVASRKPKEIKHAHEGEANFTTESAQKPHRTTAMFTHHGKISGAQRPITYHRHAATDAVAGRHAKDDKHTPIMW